MDPLPPCIAPRGLGTRHRLLLQAIHPAWPTGALLIRPGRVLSGAPGIVAGIQVGNLAAQLGREGQSSIGAMTIPFRFALSCRWSILISRR